MIADVFVSCTLGAFSWSGDPLIARCHGLLECLPKSRGGPWAPQPGLINMSKLCAVALTQQVVLAVLLFLRNLQLLLRIKFQCLDL